MNKNSIKEISLMNALLCLGVVMIHLTSAPLGTLIRPSMAHTFIFIINKSLCFCVPAFLFLSGFKLHNRYQNTEINLKKFFCTRVKKIIIPYIISVLIYYVYFQNKSWVSAKDLPQYMLLGTLVAHFYYIVIAVQMYIVFPMLKDVFEKHALLILVIALICTLYSHKYVLRFTYFDRFIGTYIFYFILGMIFSKYKLCEKANAVIISGIAGFIITGIIHLKLSYMVITDGFIYRFAETVNTVYVTFAIVMLYGICIKLCAKSNLIYKFADAVSDASYDIYLYHILIIFLLQYDVYPNFSLSIKDMFALSLTIVYSLIFTYIALRYKIKCQKP